jgi:hypothetical protein
MLHRPPRLQPRLRLACLLLAPLLLAGCDLLGIESASAVAAKKDADGRAIGAACRHAARSIEQCYTLNRRAEKAAVFNGWREMNDYMRENNLEAMPAVVDPVTADAEAQAEAEPRGGRPDS